MKKINHPARQSGFSLAIVIVLAMAISLIGFTCFQLLYGDGPSYDSGSVELNGTLKNSKSGPIVWKWNGKAWLASSRPPTCADVPVLKRSPADITRATGIFYPGQVRGNGYMSGGGFRFDTSNNDDITILAPVDSRIISGARYYQDGQLEYALNMQTDCGVAYSFDHLLELDPAVQTLVEQLPAAEVAAASPRSFATPMELRAGQAVAMAIGDRNTHVVAFDFGVYDLRLRNLSAADPAYLSAHHSDLSTTAYAICWLSILPGNDAQIARALPAADPSAGKQSDYCK